MSTCNCCIVYDLSVSEGNAILTGVNSLNIDTNLTFDWWDETDNECNPYNTKLDLIGPAITSLQLTAHPFDNDSMEEYGYTMGFSCPFELSVSIGYKFINSCNECVDCIDPITGEVIGRRRGRWIGVPNRKRDIKITGNIDDIPSSLMEFGDRLYRVNKLNVQAGQQPFIIPPITYAYKSVKYKGGPLLVDTTQDFVYEFSVNSEKSCQGMLKVNNIEAYLTNFTWKFEPPNPPTCNYTFNWYTAFCNI